MDFLPDPYSRQCPSRQLLDRIGDKWTVLVLGVLAPGPRRYGDLARAIEGVSQKMLTQTLRHLERDGLVTRTVHASVPVRVDYELTDLGRSLTGPLAVLTAWATDHLPAIEEARAAYDATRDAGAPARTDTRASAPVATYQATTG
ncbi:helix-turn-helix domain-containing protein [Nocardioides sp. CFH 31398]|uniref:winged helix-turn-helix transcriptional regulator n=1 Tax=Nocardioides sp. CFH 31398 TaxID=2919579 RepID=UPI001F066A12|nr:helix-turn-helix domain-containing protein [Nocardioides sp. CFH 31398]MCH1868491.1 helix-turn-helix transcriptional regulator [Nocardioides sp. CFH 31398]